MNSILQASNQQNYFNPSLIRPDHTPVDIRDILRARGCNGCELGTQEGLKRPVVHRGNTKASKMIIGEAPGLNENIDGIPFTGLAGQLLDKMWASLGWDINKDWLLTNVIKCRPIAPKGSGRQNLTPKAQQLKNCRPYIVQEIRSISPKIVVLLGGIAVKSIFPQEKRTQTQLAGKILYGEEFSGVTFFVMFHPAYLLHSQGTDRYPQIKEENRNHLKSLKEIVNDIG